MRIVNMSRTERQGFFTIVYPWFDNTPVFYPEERRDFTLAELREIIKEMEKMEATNAIR